MKASLPFQCVLIRIMLCIVCIIPLHAQTTPTQESSDTFSFEVQKPNFKNGDYFSYWGVFLYSKIALSQNKKVYLIAEIPFAIEKSHSEVFTFEDFSITVGNDKTVHYIGNP